MSASVAVTVDDREPIGLIDAVRENPDVESVTVERLPAGDLVAGSTAIERKTLRDYVSAVMGRSGPDLTDQVERMSERYDHAYVLLEGDLGGFDALRTGVSPAAIRGSMASITARQETPVIPCSDRRLLVDLAVRLCRKHVEDPATRPLPVGAVPSRAEPTAKRMYACIDGVGPEIADALYEAYPTVAELVAASREELTRIDGVGEKRARTIRAALSDSPLD